MSIDRRQLQYVSFLYYEKGLTQFEISKKLGLSRMKISRLLQQARNLDIVKITIDYQGAYFNLEEIIEKKYSIKEAIVVDSIIGKNSKQMIAAAAASYLEDHLTSNDTVAVGWGTTLQLVDKYVEFTNEKLLFLPIIGGHGKNELDIHASTIASNLAKKIKCQSMSLSAPAFLQNKESKEILIKDPLISEVLEQAAKAKYAIFSVGNPLIEDSTLHRSGYFSIKDIESLHKEKAICDLVSILFLNNEGKQCCKEITDKSVGIDYLSFKKIPNKICIVEGADKFEGVKIALKAGYIDVIILDSNMAEYLCSPTSGE